MVKAEKNNQDQIKKRVNHLILVAKLQPKRVPNRLGRGAVAAARVAHQDQHILGLIRPNLHHLHRPFPLVIILYIILPLLLAAPTGKSLKHRVYRLPRRRHRRHHTQIYTNYTVICIYVDTGTDV